MRILGSRSELGILQVRPEPFALTVTSPLLPPGAVTGTAVAVARGDGAGHGTEIAPRLILILATQQVKLSESNCSALANRRSIKM